MKILLFGGSGQVGQELRLRGKALNFEIIAPVTSDVNITDAEQVRFLAEKIKPAVIINCAAYTAVDRAETDSEQAYRVNAQGASNVALAAHSVAARLMHISTDYVYDGNFSEPIKESAACKPLNVYGASKLEGERLVSQIMQGGELIIRTSSVHGKYGQNIVHTVLKLLEDRDNLQFIEDQIMSPTWAGWLAESILDLARIDCSGILHASGQGAISWYEFACKILEIAKLKEANWQNKTISPIKAADLPRPAARPAYSVLSTARLEGLLGRPAIAWDVALRNHMREIGF